MSKLARNLLIAGLLLVFVFPALGFIGAFFFMARAFHDLGQTGITDPNHLAGHMGNALFVMAAGLTIGVVFIIPGIGLMIASGCVMYGERRKAGL